MSIKDAKELFNFCIKQLFAVIVGVVVTYIFYITVLKPIETDKYKINLGKELSNQKKIYDENLAEKKEEINALSVNLESTKGKLIKASEKAKCRSKKVSVVFIDGNGTFAGYRKENQTKDSSNAHFLKNFTGKTDELSEKMEPVDAILAKNGVIDFEKVIKLKPDIIVIHRSTFDYKFDESGKKKREPNSEERLKDLLKGLHEKGVKVPVVIFSRTPKTNINYAFGLGGSNFSERLITFQFKEGNPFEIDDHVKYFLNFVSMVGRSQVCNWEPASEN